MIVCTIYSVSLAIARHACYTLLQYPGLHIGYTVTLCNSQAMSHITFMIITVYMHIGQWKVLGKLFTSGSDSYSSVLCVQDYVYILQFVHT